MYEMRVGLAGAVVRTAPVVLIVLMLAGCSKTPAPNDCMPVLTVDEDNGSIKCEAGEQYVEQFEYEIKPRVLGSTGNELYDCLSDPACTEHIRNIGNMPDRIKALQRRVDAQEKRIAELERMPEPFKPSFNHGSSVEVPNEPIVGGLATVFDMHADGHGMTARQVAGDNWKPLRYVVGGLDPEEKIDRAEIYQQGFKEIRIYYGDGGVWCNVWADAEGIHWEACK